MNMKRAIMGDSFKRIVLVSQHDDGHYDICHFDTEEEAIKQAEMNTAVIPISVMNFKDETVVYFE